MHGGRRWRGAVGGRLWLSDVVEIGRSVPGLVMVMGCGAACPCCLGKWEGNLESRSVREWLLGGGTVGTGPAMRLPSTPPTSRRLKLAGFCDNVHAAFIVSPSNSITFSLLGHLSSFARGIPSAHPIATSTDLSPRPARPHPTAPPLRTTTTTTTTPRSPSTTRVGSRQETQPASRRRECLAVQRAALQRTTSIKAQPRGKRAIAICCSPNDSANDRVQDSTGQRQSLVASGFAPAIFRL
jgi:hypothetical protein